MVTIRGAGFPPGADVQLLVGEFVATVHVFFGLNPARADQEGRVEVQRELPLVCGPNSPREQAVFASLDGARALEGRWFARYRLNEGR